MLQGGCDFSNLDPYATKPDGGKPTITGPHVMVVGPAVKAIPGYDRTGNDANVKVPYVIWKDTPYEHLMVPMLRLGTAEFGSEDPFSPRRQIRRFRSRVWRFRSVCMVN